MIKFFIFGVTLFSFPLAAMSLDNDTPLQIQKQAAMNYRMGHYKESAALYKKLAALQPNDPDVLRDLMWALWKSGDSKETISVATKLTKIDPNDTDALGVLARAEQATGNTDEGIKNFQKVLMKESMNGQVKLALGRLYMGKGDFDEAEKLLRQAQAESPGNREVYPALAKLQTLRGDFESAAKTWKKALKQSPNRSDYKFSEAYALYQSGQIELALALFKEMLSDKDQNRRALSILVNNALDNGELDTAAELLESNLTHPTQAGDQARLLKLARIYNEMEQPENVMATLDSLLSLNPDYAPAELMKANMMFDIKRDYDEAIRLFQKAENSFPDDPKLYPKLATALFLKGQYSASADAWSKAVALSPERSDYKYKYAEALYYSKHYDQALTLFKSLLNDPEQKKHALDFLVGDAVVRGQPATAAKLIEQSPLAEENLLEVASLYHDMGQNKKSLEILKKHLDAHPEDTQAYLLKGTILSTLNEREERLRLYQMLASANPTSTFYLLLLAEAQYNANQRDAAIETVRKARKLEPNNPYLLMREADYLHDNGDWNNAKQLVTNWLKANKEPSLTVLAYHGLTPFKRDPLLFHPYHLTTSVFEDQVRALKKAGFTSVTCEQVYDWMRGKADLPAHPVLIAFDDGRQDSFKNADPILKKYGMKATAFVPVWTIERNIPNYVNWDDLIHWKETGRWEIQAHGDEGHTYIPVDAQGNKKLFLTAKKWLADKNRVETQQEYTDRVINDHKNAQLKMAQNMHAPPPMAFAFPEGNYGQYNMTGFPTTGLIIELAKDVYALSFYEDLLGINVRTENTGLLRRVLPLQTQSGDALVQHIADRNPFSVARQSLLRWAAWEGKPREALDRLEDLKKGGASQFTVLTSESLIHASRSDLATAQKLAMEASQIALPEYRSTPSKTISDKKRLVWKPTIEYSQESHDRTSLVFFQSLDFLHIGNTAWRLMNSFAKFRENKVPSVNETGIGLGMDLGLGLYHDLDIQGLHYSLSDNLSNTYAVAGALNSIWTDSFQTNIKFQRSPIYTARALNKEIMRNGAELNAGFNLGDLWRMHLYGNESRFSDDNQRHTGVFELSKYFDHVDGLRLGYRFTADDSQRDSLDYYAPLHLFQQQLGIDLPVFGKGSYQCRLAYWPGIGKEEGVGARAVQSVELDLTQKWKENIGFGLVGGYDSTPTYHSFHSKFGLEFRF